MTTLYIKNMVCPRCIKVVSDEMDKLGLNYLDVQLGNVKFMKTLSPSELVAFKSALENNGFELLDDKKSRIIEQIKLLVIDYIRNEKLSNLEVNFSKIISDEIHLEYTYVSTLFSSVEGRSIERYMIQQKVERIKELITYDELSIKQIADKLGYSSLQALSSQFKKETGFTPTDFKKLSDSSKGRKFIDRI